MQHSIVTIIEEDERWEVWKDCLILWPDGSYQPVTFIDKGEWFKDNEEDAPHSDEDILIDLSRTAVIDWAINTARSNHNIINPDVVIGKFAN